MFNLWILGLISCIAIVLSYWSTFWITKYAQARNITDDPLSNPLRKKQKEPIPLLGATGFVIVALLLSSLCWVLRDSSFLNLGSLLDLNDGNVRFGWIILSVVILMIGGYFDDRFNLAAKWMFFPISLALLVAVIGGNLEISALSYPFNNVLPQWEVLPEVLAFLWLGLCLAATKFLDGHDGLVTIVGVIALLSIASVSLFSNVFQPLVFALAIIWIGSLIGFLPHNFPNAKVYLGEGGSEIIGFIVGVLAIISGAKIATAATVIGWFILDIILVITWRFLADRKLFEGDRLHWHFRLVDLGLNKLQVLVLTTFILLVTAQTGLYVPTEHKAIVLAGQTILLCFIFIVTMLLSLWKARRVPAVTSDDPNIQIIAQKDDLSAEIKQLKIDEKEVLLAQSSIDTDCDENRHNIDTAPNTINVETAATKLKKSPPPKKKKKNKRKKKKKR